jgi:hypothetical protein
MEISAPTNFDFTVLRKLKNEVYDTYGSLNNNQEESVLQTCTLPTISMEKLKKYVEYSHSLGIKFNYIMNHPDNSINKKIVGLLNKLDKANVDIITASNPKLISFIKREYSFKISSSIACIIDTLAKAKKYESLGCDILCLFYSKNKDLKFIKLVKQKTKSKIKLLVNNLCLIDCPYRTEHLREPQQVGMPELKCLKLKLENQSLLQETGFLHPKEMKKYEEIGVDFIKLGGRTKPTWWVINCVNAYYNKKYDGNAFKIMNTTSSENRHSPIIKNLALLFPELFIKKGFIFLHLLSKKRIFKMISQEKNVKDLSKVYLSRDIFNVDKDKISVDKKKKNDLLRAINSILKN